jgi:hypothetical protein
VGPAASSHRCNFHLYAPQRAVIRLLMNGHGWTTSRTLATTLLLERILTMSITAERKAELVTQYPNK